MARIKDVTIKYIDENLKTLRTVSSGEPIDYISGMGSNDRIPFRTGYNEYRVNDKPVTLDQFDKVVDYLSHGGLGEIKVDYGDCSVLYVDSIARKVKYRDGSSQYFNSDGVLHREDGPAYLDDKTSRYYWDGQRISKEDHQARTTEKKMIKKNVLEFDESQKQLIYNDNGLFFKWMVPERKLEVIREFTKNQTGKRFFELTGYSGKKEVITFENGLIKTRSLLTATVDKTFAYQDDGLVKCQISGKKANITFNKLKRELLYYNEDLSFIWKVPEGELQKIVNWIAGDLSTDLTVTIENLSKEKEEITFKGEELVKRNVGAKRECYEYKDGKQMVNKTEKNLLSLCRDYSFPSEYFGAKGCGLNDFSENKVFIYDGWQIHKYGVLHSETGPAQVQANNPPEYYLGGQRLSKEEWLCLKDPKYSGPVSFGIKNDEVRFFKEGKLHREFGPAVIDKDGTRKWYKKGKLHREDGPALITYDDMKWAIDGQTFEKHGAEFEKAKEQYLQLQQRKDRPIDAPHITRSLGFRDRADVFLVGNHTEDDYSWIMSKESGGIKQSFFIDLKEMDIPEEISKSQEFGEAVLDTFLEEEWYENWYSISTDKKLDKIAKKYLENAESKTTKVAKNISHFQTLIEKEYARDISYSNKKDSTRKPNTYTVPFVELGEKGLENHTVEEKNKFMDQFTQDLMKELKKQEDQILIKEQEEQDNEFELVNRTLKKINECYVNKSKINDLLLEITRPHANGESFTDQIKSIENKNIIINAVAELSDYLMKKDKKILQKEIDKTIKKEPMVITREDDSWVEKEVYSANLDHLTLPEETKKGKAKKSLGVVKDVTKQGVKIGVATEGANIAYDSVKSMLVNVLDISPKALESKVNQELIMMTALAMTHLAAEIYSDKVNADKIQELCGLVMEGKVKDNTRNLMKMVPILMNVSKKMDVESKLRFDTPEVVAQEVLPEELMEALNEAEEVEEEYARNQS